MPATIKVELAKYTHALFGAEAKTYIRHAGSESELRSRLDSLASRIQIEVTRETKRLSRKHDLHCPLTERIEAITNALQKAAGYWIKAYETDPFAAMARHRATSAHLETTMSQAREVLAKLDARPETPDPLIGPLSIRDRVSPSKEDQVPKDTNEERSSVELRSAARTAFVNPILKKKGMTRSKLASKAGVDPSVVYDYLSGISNPRPDNRNLLAEVLGVDESTLPD